MDAIQFPGMDNMPPDVRDMVVQLLTKLAETYAAKPNVSQPPKPVIPKLPLQVPTKPLPVPKNIEAVRSISRTIEIEQWGAASLQEQDDIHAIAMLFQNVKSAKQLEQFVERNRFHMSARRLGLLRIAALALGYIDVASFVDMPSFIWTDDLVHRAYDKLKQLGRAGFDAESLQLATVLGDLQTVRAFLRTSIDISYCHRSNFENIIAIYSFWLQSDKADAFREVHESLRQEFHSDSTHGAYIWLDAICGLSLSDTTAFDRLVDEPMPDSFYSAVMDQIWRTENSQLLARLAGRATHGNLSSLAYATMRLYSRSRDILTEVMSELRQIKRIVFMAEFITEAALFGCEPPMGSDTHIHEVCVTYNLPIASVYKRALPAIVHIDNDAWLEQMRQFVDVDDFICNRLNEMKTNIFNLGIRILSDPSMPSVRNLYKHVMSASIKPDLWDTYAIERITRNLCGINALEEIFRKIYILDELFSAIDLETLETARMTVALIRERVEPAIRIHMRDSKPASDSGDAGSEAGDVFLDTESDISPEPSASGDITSVLVVQDDSEKPTSARREDYEDIEDGFVMTESGHLLPPPFSTMSGYFGSQTLSRA